MIPYGRQCVADSEIEALANVLGSAYLTQGPKVTAFEDALAHRTGAAFGVAMNSATSGLHVACLALGLGPDTWLWTSPNSFVASANVGLLCGAKVDFVDIDPHTLNMSVDALEAKLCEAQRAGRLPHIVIPVHFGGEPCDMAAIGALAGRFGFRVIEDASHAVGARHDGSPVGACRYSDVTVFSFHPVKIITTGEGGMALTNDPDLADRMRRLVSHGVTRDRDRFEAPDDGPWAYQQLELGLNYRLTDLAAALGLAQLQRLDDFLDRRAALVSRYEEALKRAPVTSQRRSPSNASSHHLHVIMVETAERRRQLFDTCRDKGIGVNVHYIPIHTQPFYRRLGFTRGYCPFAEQYYERTLTLPLFPQLSEGDQDHVIATVQQALSEPVATRTQDGMDGIMADPEERPRA